MVIRILLSRPFFCIKDEIWHTWDMWYWFDIESSHLWATYIFGVKNYTVIKRLDCNNWDNCGVQNRTIAKNRKSKLRNWNIGDQNCIIMIYDGGPKVAHWNLRDQNCTITIPNGPKVQISLLNILGYLFKLF